TALEASSWAISCEPGGGTAYSCTWAGSTGGRAGASITRETPAQPARPGTASRTARTRVRARIVGSRQDVRASSGGAGERPANRARAHAGPTGKAAPVAPAYPCVFFTPVHRSDTIRVRHAG